VVDELGSASWGTGYDFFEKSALLLRALVVKNQEATSFED